jgi:serine/threonine protein kinase
MEKADCDLQTYLSQNDVSTSQKIALFRDVVSDFKKIHDIGIYHRDIKPANFLMFGTTCKISDFGLAGYRGQDYIDGRERRIGPWGFLSPEAINRLYASRDRSINIDDSSDIFQLGLLFWYILNSEVPTGIFEKADMQVEAHSLDTIDQCFHILFAMMQFKKERRTSCQDVYTALSQLVV